MEYWDIKIMIKSPLLALALISTGTLLVACQKNSNYNIDNANITAQNMLQQIKINQIGDDVYEDLHKSSLKAFYYNRASIALTEDLATKWQRQAGHLDNEVLVHQSAASEYRPEGTSIASTKGWYDAGDYGKYIVNSGIATYTLLSSYEHHHQL